MSGGNAGLLFAQSAEETAVNRRSEQRKKRTPRTGYERSGMHATDVLLLMIFPTFFQQIQLFSKNQMVRVKMNMHKKLQNFPFLIQFMDYLALNNMSRYYLISTWAIW